MAGVFQTGRGEGPGCNRCDVSFLPVQLYFKGDNMVDVLQHISHCGVRSICHTGQRHRVPLAHLDQTWTHTHEHRNMRQQQTCFMFFYSSSICVLHLWPVLQSCASIPVSAGPSLSAGWTAGLSWPAQTQRVLLSSLFPEGSPCAPPRRTPATDSLRWRTHIISQSMTQMRLICNIMFPERGKIHTELPHVSSCTSAVPVLALWPRCGRFLGSRTPLPAPLLGRGSRSVLFQPSQLGRRGPGVYNRINALGFLGTITQGVHLWRHTDTETQTLKN